MFKLQKTSKYSDIKSQIQKKVLNKSIKGVDSFIFEMQKQQKQERQKSQNALQKQLQYLKKQINDLSFRAKESKQRFCNNKAKEQLKNKIDHQNNIKSIQNSIHAFQKQIQDKINSSKNKYMHQDPTKEHKIIAQFIKTQGKQTFNQVQTQIQKCFNSIGQIQCILQSLKDVQRKQNVKLKLKELKPYLQSMESEGQIIELNKIQFLCSLNQLQLFVSKNRSNLKIECYMTISNLKNSILTLEKIQAQIKNSDNNQGKVSFLKHKNKECESLFYQYYEEWLNFKSRLKGTSNFVILSLSKIKQKLVQDQILFKQFDKVHKISACFLSNIWTIQENIQSIDKIEHCNPNQLADLFQS